MPCTSTTSAEDTALSQLADLENALVALRLYIAQEKARTPDSRFYSYRIMQGDLWKVTQIITQTLCARVEAEEGEPLFVWASHHAEVDALRKEIEELKKKKE